MKIMEVLQKCKIEDEQKALDIGNKIVKKLYDNKEFCCEAETNYKNGMIYIETIVSLSFYGEPYNNYICNISISVGPETFVDCQVDTSDEMNDYAAEYIQDIVTRCITDVFSKSDSREH